MDRLQQRFERFAQLRAAYPDISYDEIMGRICEEEIDADEVAHLRMVDAQDEERRERYMDAA